MNIFRGFAAEAAPAAEQEVAEPANIRTHGTVLDGIAWDRDWHDVCFRYVAARLCS